LFNFKPLQKETHPLTKKFEVVEHCIYWNGSHEVVYLIPATKPSLPGHDNMPCLNLITGEVKTLKEVYRDPNMRPAGLENPHESWYSYTKYGRQVEELELSDAMSSREICEIVRFTHKPVAFVHSAWDKKAPTSFDSYNFMFAYHFPEYREYMLKMFPDIDFNPGHYVYPIIKDDNLYIFDYNQGLINDSVGFFNFGDGIYSCNGLIHGNQPYPDHKALHMVRGLFPQLELSEWKAESFTGTDQ